MASTLKVENFFDTVIASTFVNSSGDVSVQLGQAPTNTKGFIIFSPDNANLREIAYYDSTSGTTINIKGINRINPKEHSQGETARINDVAELFNYFSGNTSHAFYIEKLSSTLINVFGGNVMINGTTYTLNDTQFSLPLDGTYYIGLNINSGLIEMQPTIVSYIIPRATVVKVGSSLTITYSKYDMTVMYGVFDGVIPPALVASINDKLNKVSGLRTSMTPKAFMVTDAAGNEGTLTGTSNQIVGFDASGVPIAKADGSDINSKTEKFTFQGQDLLLVYDVSSGTNKKEKMSTLFSVYGDGSDGDVIISSNTTLVRDMYYKNLTINSTIVLNPNGYKIYVSETLTNNGIIRRNGNPGSPGAASSSTFPGGAGGAALNQGSLNADIGGQQGSANTNGVGVDGTSVNPSYTIINGANGGKGTNSLGNRAAGVGGTATRGSLYNIALTAHQVLMSLFNPPSTLIQYVGLYKGAAGSGSGSGDWTPNAGATGGGSGGNGGIIWISARVFVNNGVIESKGGDGGAGGFASAWQQAGGGGGGQGGVFYLIYSTLTALGTITLTGGAAGANGSIPAQAGNTGVIIQINVLT